MPNSENGTVKPVSWATLSGRWSFGQEEVVYEGPNEGASVPYGLAVCNLQLRDGTVAATITFKSLQDASAGVVLGFRSESANYAVPQLGGHTKAYSIAEFEPGQGWRVIVAAGTITNLAVGKPYNLRVTLRGQKIRMAVDDVSIFEYILSTPLSGDQIGLYAFGQSEVRFEKVTAEDERPRAFVAMPFQEPFNTLYREVIKPEADERGFSVIRVDEISGPGIIFEDIKREIGEAKVVIAEITAPNQNVFYELGYAHALNKPTILLAQRGKELPFDIKSYRVIFYDDTIGGKPEVERNLRKHLHAILKDL